MSKGQEKITQEVFDHWPALLSRWHLVQCGFKRDVLSHYVVNVSAGEPTPPGKIGRVSPLPWSQIGKYRKCDVAQLIGLKI